MKQNRTKKGRITTVALLGALGAASAMPVPVHAETELEALRREVAEQRALINKLLAAQANQEAAIEKIETRAAQVPTQMPIQTPAQASAQTSGQAAAQTPVQVVNSILPKGLSVYGRVDVSVANTNSGNGRHFTVGSAGMTATSLGLKGEKAVGHGLKVVGNVEMGIDLSTGVAGNGPGGTIGDNMNVASSGGLTGTGNQIFSRQAYAGLGSDILGQVTLGRQYSGSYLTIASESTAFGPGFYGSSAVFLPVIGGMPTRLNNSIVYQTPAFEGFLRGFTAYATYTAGSENNLDEAKATNTYDANGNIVSSTRTTDSSGEGYDLALTYRFKGLSTAVSAWNVENASYNAFGGETGLATRRGWQAAVNYDFGLAKLYGHYISGWYSGGNYKNVTKTLSDADGWSVSAKVPYQKHSVIANFSQLNDKSLNNADASLFGVAYTYQIIDDTWLYISWGQMFNDDNAKYSLMNGGDLVGTVGEVGYQPDGVMMGVNTKF
ncbi:MAG TPA: hypothetical protein DEB25_03680 [Desulfobulbaceae bacterium]|nr:hypothetical protein [Desulfobulbaceae bacterium]